MNNKKTFNVDKLINTEILKGDYVKFIDGSGLSADELDTTLYIVYSYPELFGTITKIKDLVFEVLKTNIDNKIIKGVDTFYLQDISLKLVNCDNIITVRTPSKFVKKI